MEAENTIRTLWLAQRTLQEAERLADEAWSSGLRLAGSPHVHYLHVMNLVRRTLMK